MIIQIYIIPKNCDTSVDYVLLTERVERKGSCDSLTSQRSNDSQSIAPVRDTLFRAKRQIQALMGQYIYIYIYELW